MIQKLCKLETDIKIYACLKIPRYLCLKIERQHMSMAKLTVSVWRNGLCAMIDMANGDENNLFHHACMIF